MSLTPKKRNREELLERVYAAREAHSKAAAARDRAVEKADKAWDELTTAEADLGLHDLLKKKP